MLLSLNAHVSNSLNGCRPGASLSSDVVAHKMGIARRLPFDICMGRRTAVALVCYSIAWLDSLHQPAAQLEQGR
jgi:hypothetical protein